MSTKAKKKKEDTKKKDKKEEKTITLTEAEYKNKMASQRKKGGKALLKKLGFEDEDELEDTVSTFQELLETQKKPEDKNKEKQEKEAAKARKAEERAELAEAKLEAIQAGVNPDYVEDVMVIASSKKNDDNEYSDIFDEMKEKYEVFFGESKSDKDDDETKKDDRGTGSSMKSSKDEGDGEEDDSVGARLGASRAAAAKKENSFWK